ncbi:hypothetical protein PsYK624_039490 [Phanerochaete sordida]|uniref:Uncharacterized protein n=1 Tax=Phanerochaete sordida TaxID=48140 RepID=A0A9P3LA71_9APHY|nr:hypothetical protein PsYK624_039490 [Phanerochaete sordida]
MKRFSDSRLSWSSSKATPIARSDSDSSTLSSSSEASTSLSSTVYLPETAYSSQSNLGVVAEVLEDENQAWGKPRKPKSRQ